VLELRAHPMLAGIRLPTRSPLGEHLPRGPPLNLTVI
jgi:hypothetical protein